jgi:uncharacterized protein
MLLLLIFSVNTIAQQPSFVKQVKKHIIKSKFTGQQYELFVSLPKKYSTKDTISYPVLYVLDGNFMFPVLNNMQQLLNETNEVKDMIIVGVGYPTNDILESTVNRTPDYTPTRDTAFENMLKKDMKMSVKTGGAENFLIALKQDIFPLIEKTYRTKGRGIAGHSFGALFGAYVLLHAPSTFDKYLLSSISIFWDKNIVLQQEKDFYSKGNKSMNAKVFLTVGEAETYMDMIPGMKQLAASLREHKYEGLKIEERVLPNETHASAFITAYNQGLRWLYKK